MKKFIALFMCIALIAVCFVACKKQQVEEETTEAETTAAVEETTADTTPAESQAVAEEMYGTDRDPYAQDLENWD